MFAAAEMLGATACAATAVPERRPRACSWRRSSRTRCKSAVSSSSSPSSWSNDWSLLVVPRDRRNERKMHSEWYQWTREECPLCRSGGVGRG